MAQTKKNWHTSSMEVKNFWFTELLDERIEIKTREIDQENEKIRYWNNTHPDQKPKKKIPFYKEKVRSEAYMELRKWMAKLKKGTPEQRAKILVIENEIKYIRKLEKHNLSQKIDFKLNVVSDGCFTLDEAGSVVGNVTRERARQIEDSAMKKIKNPMALRVLREARYV